MKASTPKVDQLTICTRQCGGRCCRYLTVSIDAPRAQADWDEIRWWLAHTGVMVTQDDEGWMLHVQTGCSHLRPDNTCGIYAHRMTTCSEYAAENCEFTDDVPYDVHLQSEDDLADHLEKRKLKRGAPVARAIRASVPLRQHENLVPLQLFPAK